MIAAPRVKVCGLMRHVDAAAAEAEGAWYGGAILSPGHRRSVELDAAAAIFSGSGLRRAGVFVNADAATIRRAIDVVGLDVVQLHGDETPDLAAGLREQGGVAIWKAVRLRSPADFLDAVDRFAGSVDALLLDGWTAGAHGGTGASFRWDAIAEHRDALPAGIDLVVAGGLRAGNVARAISLLRPAAVDVSSGVESEPGTKDQRLIRAFVAAARDTAGSD